MCPKRRPLMGLRCWSFPVYPTPAIPLHEHSACAPSAPATTGMCNDHPPGQMALLILTLFFFSELTTVGRTLVRKDRSLTSVGQGGHAQGRVHGQGVRPLPARPRGSTARVYQSPV